jgi:hypothetical protein
MGLARILNGVMEQASNGLLLVASVFPHQGADTDHMGEERDGLCVAHLMPMQLFRPAKGLGVARGCGHDWNLPIRSGDQPGAPPPLSSTNRTTTERASAL